MNEYYQCHIIELFINDNTIKWHFKFNIHKNRKITPREIHEGYILR